MFGRAALTSAMISLWLFAQLLEGAHRLEMENQNFSEFIDWSYLYMKMYIFPPSRRINSLREINEAARANKKSRISYAIIFIPHDFWLTARLGGAHKPGTENQNLLEFLGWLCPSTRIYALSRAVAQIVQER